MICMLDIQTIDPGDVDTVFLLIVLHSLAKVPMCHLRIIMAATAITVRLTVLLYEL